MTSDIKISNDSDTPAEFIDINISTQLDFETSATSSPKLYINSYDFNLLDLRELSSPSAIFERRTIPRSTQNDIDRKIKYIPAYKEKFDWAYYKKKLLCLILDSDAEWGYQSEADTYFQGLLKMDPDKPLQILNELFVDSYGENSPHLLITALSIVSNLEYDEAKPNGPTMALAALSHANDLVKEAGVRAYENWSDPATIDLLNNVETEKIWLKKYISDVVNDIEVEYDLFYSKDRIS